MKLFSSHNSQTPQKVKVFSKSNILKFATTDCQIYLKSLFAQQKGKKMLSSDSQSETFYVAHSRRLERNRESAKKCRLRKKQWIKGLQIKAQAYDELAKKVNDLEKQVASVTQENTLLKFELNSIHNTKLPTHAEENISFDVCEAFLI